MKRLFRWLAIVLVLVVVCVPVAVRADIAPPANPPGSSLEPGVDSTQVQMIAETVLIELQADVPEKSLAKAKVIAMFTMRNLGSDVENMAVRFPLSSNDGFGQYPEIKDFNVTVDGKNLSTRRIMQDDPVWGSDLVPWAEFDITFPPNQDVFVNVTYMLEGTGEYPYVSFNYVLHTGAGWKGSIGQADIIVSFPYKANTLNVIFDEQIGWSSTTPGGELHGERVEWYFKNLEPEQGDDIQLSIVMPSVWQKVLREQSNTQNNPDDGEAWGRLGKLYKEIYFLRRGFRHDDGGVQLFHLSVAAYEKAVTLLPDDALWHAGFADLLAVHAYYASQEGEDATAEMVRSMQEVDRALELSPNDPKVNEIAENIYYLFPDAVGLLESGYDFLWLTATPEPSVPTPEPIEPTSTPPATTPLLSTPTTVPEQEAESTPTPVPSVGNPLCGSALLLPFMLLWVTRRKGKPLL